MRVLIWPGTRLHHAWNLEMHMLSTRKRVLFICTANYYRSRYAEAVFNHFAGLLRLTWSAVSRGLNVDAVMEGDLSRYTREEMDRLGLAPSLTGARRTALALRDLEAADHVIALKELEHRPMMAAQFPDWADRIEYWDVHDLDCATAEETLSRIYDKVKVFAAHLAAFERTAVS
jgi:protein-tyrosine phosphatase